MSDGVNLNHEKKDWLAIVSAEWSDMDFAVCCAWQINWASFNTYNKKQNKMVWDKDKVSLSINTWIKLCFDSWKWQQSQQTHSL